MRDAMILVMLPRDAAYYWPLWRYEAACCDCGARMYLPDGESCIRCGGDTLQTLSGDIPQLRMDALTGRITEEGPLCC